MFLEYLIGALGLLGAGAAFYLLYRLEETGIWSELVATLNKRRVLLLVALISLLAGLLDGIIQSISNLQNSITLSILTPAAIFLGVYFLFVALFYQRVATPSH